MDLDFSKIKIEMDGCVGLTVQLPPELEDKYSRTFAEIMVKQLTVEIERACSVRGLEKSNIEIKLVFMPDTFMEHSSENVTYRRLLITDKTPIHDHAGNVWSYRIGTKSLGSGKTARLTVKAPIHDKMPISVGDIVYAAELYKNQTGYWYLLSYNIEGSDKKQKNYTFEDILNGVKEKK